MSVAEPTPAKARVQAPAANRRAVSRRAMHLVRRGHLYFGLFLLPWAILYGITGFLFNHPTAFADAPTTTLSRDDLHGTPMENPPAPAAVAEQVVAALRARANPPADYQLVQPEKARYLREFAFATVKAEGQEVSVLLDVTGNGGTIRVKAPPPPPKMEEKAPFAIKPSRPPGGPGGKAEGHAERGEKGAAPRTAAEPFTITEPLHELVKATVPVVLERTGYPGGEVTVTSVPDLSFLMTDGSKTWNVTFNSQTGGVSGKSAADMKPAEELSTRRFLTRLHTAHGYPSEQNAKWAWAVIVDVMAFVMVFWGVSGLFMWWQIKAVRKVGVVVLAASLVAATALGMGMHEILAAPKP
jgi:hypothetical protein